MKILVNSNARLKVSKPRSFKLEGEGWRSGKELRLEPLHVSEENLFGFSGSKVEVGDRMCG